MSIGFKSLFCTLLTNLGTFYLDNNSKIQNFTKGFDWMKQRKSWLSEKGSRVEFVEFCSDGGTLV